MKGEPGFESIRYKGVLIDEYIGIDWAKGNAHTQKVFFQHIHWSGGFHEGAISRHACLEMGHWCWSNLWEHPWDIVKYIRRMVSWGNGKGSHKHPTTS